MGTDASGNQHGDHMSYEEDDEDLISYSYWSIQYINEHRDGLRRQARGSLSLGSKR